MNTNISQRVAELSATLPPIEDFSNTIDINEEMYMIAEDSNSYNSSFYCDGWIKPCFEGDFRGCLLQSVEDYQVLRFYLIGMQLEGLAHDEIPEDWEDEDAPDFPEPEILGNIEYKQIWISADGRQEVNYLDEKINGVVDRKSYVVAIDSLQPWAYEPKHRQTIVDLVSESHYNSEVSAFDYSLSLIGEYLDKRANGFSRLVREHEDFKFATKFERTLRIASRHMQLPADEQTYRLYRDYLKMCDGIFDITNPKYVCPTDIVAAHDYMVSRKAKDDEERERRKAELLEEEFAEKHSYLFNIHFDNGHFEFISLDSVAAYLHEGTIMHHCIYKCKYYDRHNYLSMHIQDLEGNRVATCTIDVQSRRLVECQPIGNATGYYNTYHEQWQETNDYKEIYNTLMARMHTFPRYTTNNNNNQIRIAV